MKRMATEKKRTQRSGILISIVFGLCASIIIFIAMLTIFSIIGAATEKPHSLLTPISFFCIYTASFFGGFVSIKKNKGRDSLLCGALCGIVISLTYSLIFGLIGIICDIDSAPISWLYRILMAVASIVGALLGISKSKKMPKKKRRR